MRTCVVASFTYNPQGNRQIEQDKMVQQIEAELSQKASANPNGPQFVFTTQWPFDLFIAYKLSGRSNVPGQAYTAYWGNLEVDDKWGALFNFSTQAYESEDFFFGDQFTEIMDEATDKLYGFLANGWSCN